MTNPRNVVVLTLIASVVITFICGCAFGVFYLSPSRFEVEAVGVAEQQTFRDLREIADTIDSRLIEGRSVPITQTDFFDFIVAEQLDASDGWGDGWQFVSSCTSGVWKYTIHAGDRATRLSGSPSSIEISGPVDPIVKPPTTCPPEPWAGGYKSGTAAGSN